MEVIFFCHAILSFPIQLILAVTCKDLFFNILEMQGVNKNEFHGDDYAKAAVISFAIDAVRAG